MYRDYDMGRVRRIYTTYSLTLIIFWLMLFDIHIYQTFEQPFHFLLLYTITFSPLISLYIFIRIITSSVLIRLN